METLIRKKQTFFYIQKCHLTRFSVAYPSNWLINAFGSSVLLKHFPQNFMYSEIRFKQTKFPLIFPFICSNIISHEELSSVE